MDLILDIRKNMFILKKSYHTEMIEIVRVQNKKQLNSFIEFPRLLYSNESNCIHDLNITSKSRLVAKNPFFEHSEATFFLARDTDRGNILGRIAAIKNTIHLERYGDHTGFFGFFDSINDDKVSALLFQHAERWLKSKDLKLMVGPTNLTTNDCCGLLLRGYEFPNQVSMPYNFPYYKALLQAEGFSKFMDLYSYEITDEPDLDRYANLLERIKRKLAERGISLRSMNSKSYKDDVIRLRIAYNEFNTENWGFLPLNEKEFSTMAAELKMIMPYQFAHIAERENQIVGYIVAVPDFNQVLKRLNNGRLFPTGFLKILRHRKKINSSRVMLIGVHPKLRGSGLDLVLYHRITKALQEHQIFRCEAAYVMGSNKPMNSLLLKMGGVPIKQYGLFKKEISDHVRN